MTAISNYLENAIINAVLRNTTLSPSNAFLALFTSDPTDAGSGTEVSGAGYARAAIVFDAAAAGVTQNTDVETFTAVGGDYGVVTHIGIFDASTAGNLLFHGELATSKEVLSGGDISFAIGSIVCTFGATGWSTYLKNAMLNLVLRNTAYTSPATVYAALFTSDPTPAGSGTEVSGSGYARQATAFDAPANGVTQNTAEEVFTASGGTFGTVSHQAIFDASTAGNMLFYAALGAPEPIADGDSARFAAGALSVTVS